MGAGGDDFTIGSVWFQFRGRGTLCVLQQNSSFPISQVDSAAEISNPVTEWYHVQGRKFYAMESIKTNLYYCMTRERTSLQFNHYLNTI